MLDDLPFYFMMRLIIWPFYMTYFGMTIRGYYHKMSSGMHYIMILLLVGMIARLVLDIALLVLN